MSEYGFLFKPFADMTDADYAEVGFRSGLEIHQQLLTAKKLFCRCPAGRYSDKYDAEILRHMRPTLSELGEYDGTALMEFKTRKEIIYRINRETVCTYEMDDTPPFMMDEEALDEALGVAMLYNLALVDELHIARKQYLDGSHPDRLPADDHRRRQRLRSPTRTAASPSSSSASRRTPAARSATSATAAST